MSVTNTQIVSFSNAQESASSPASPKRWPSVVSILETLLQAGVFVAIAGLPITIATAALLYGG